MKLAATPKDDEAFLNLNIKSARDSEVNISSSSSDNVSRVNISNEDLPFEHDHDSFEPSVSE